MESRWWNRCPGRLPYELQKLAEAGIECNIDQATFEAGVVEMTLKHSLPSGPLALRARFPAFYPYQRFELYAPDLALPHHQNPFAKNLCMIGQASENWRID